MNNNVVKLDTIVDKVLSYRPNKNNKANRKKLRLLDLFCCAGGAGTGYHQAGFDVVGVDINQQLNYPFTFVCADALKLDPEFIASFDAIHASPPCQSYSDLAKRNGNADDWPRLIEPVRELLIQTGLPYIIENVEGAPLINPVILCGTMFPGLRVIRHRLFEANFEIVASLTMVKPMNGWTLFRLQVEGIAR